MLSLHLYDRTDKWNRRWGYVGKDEPGVIYTGVASYQDIEDELRRIGGLGGRIDELWVHSHGAPGIIGIPYSAPAVCLDASNVANLAPVCRKAMASPAKVFWTGCNVGEGPQGEAFLRAAGPAMLGKGGGAMLASTSRTDSILFLGEWLPPWAQVRVAKVSPGGAVVISSSAFAMNWSNVARLLRATPIPLHVR
jgi:hypothetical protein